jgi:hypothetical protein
MSRVIRWWPPSWSGAINERAAAFYEGNGFVRLPDSLRLVLPMDVIKRLVKP